MQANIGNADRALRLGLGTLLLALAAYFKSLFILLIALFTLYQAVVGWCVLYQLMGKNSCPIVKTLPYHPWVLGALAAGFIFDGLYHLFIGESFFVAADLILALGLIYLAYKK